MINLTERELLILESLIQQFVVTANPIGSRFLSKKIKTKLSPATIRNVLTDLDEKGLIVQPHTSAGRIPTDKGYRVFVNDIMRRTSLSQPEKEVIQKRLAALSPDQDLILTRASQALSEVSKQLGVVLSPRFEKGIFGRLDLIHLSEKKLLAVISIKSGLVRTVTIELKADISIEKLEDTARILNERLQGLTLAAIRESIDRRMDDVLEGDVGLINLFIESVDQLFQLNEVDSIHFDGVHHMVGQPEFSNLSRTQQMIELVEAKKNLIVHVLNDSGIEDSLSIIIGTENNEILMKDLSLVSATYHVGSVTGVLGIIGPTRMQYARMVALVDYMAQSVSRLLGNG
jgi:heat-inducible transcriptional repressor